MIVEVDDKKVTLCDDRCLDRYLALPPEKQREIVETSERGRCPICALDMGAEGCRL